MNKREKSRKGKEKRLEGRKLKRRSRSFIVYNEWTQLTSSATGSDLIKNM